LLYILVGQDDYSLSKSLEEIKKSMGEQSLVAANTTKLDGRQVTLVQLRTVCETMPFLVERRLIIVEGLLERFENKSKSSRRKKARYPDRQQNGYKALADYICKLPNNVVLVLIDGRVTSRNPVFKEIVAKAVVKRFPLLRGARLRQWIQKHVVEKGGTISPQAVDLLGKLVGGNLWVMANEIDKLVLFASGRRIEQEDIRMVVSYAQQASVFAMIDAILELKLGLAERILHQLLQGGASSAYLLAMLSRQVRMMVRVKELKSQGKPEKEIQNKLGLTSEFAWRKTVEQAGKYSMRRIRKVYDKLLEADLGIKTGKYDNALALDILSAEICRRGKV